MFIDQILYPVEALGPGKRVGIWLVGCNRACPGCSNPELWSTQNRKSVSVSELMFVIHDVCSKNHVDGFTISGGEPMQQAAELADLVFQLSQICKDILVFTGYTYDEVSRDSTMAEVLDHIAVLVDGPYLEERNERLVLRGSSNQQILLFEPELEDLYVQYLNQAQSNIQNLHFPDETISIGIHARNFPEAIEQKLREYGIRSVYNG